MTHPTLSGSVCEECGQRPATVVWGDALAMTHGGGQARCDVCALTTQVEHARERAAALPDLERQLADALAADPPTLPEPRAVCRGEQHGPSYYHVPKRVDEDGTCPACRDWPKPFTRTGS